jgi:uncharacterized protein (DUF2267 family)
MTSDELLSAVRQRAELASRAEAERVTTAVLATLGERLAGGEPGDLAAQLPPDLAAALASAGPGESFGPEEFDRRVATRSGTSSAVAHRYSAAVLTTVLEAVSAGERADVLAQLPDELAMLVGDLGGTR